MRPRSLSATAIQTSMRCLSRYHAEHIVYGRGSSGDAALLGTSCHGAFEMFVKMCYLEKSQEPTEKLIIDLYQMSFAATFGDLDKKSDDYRDGLKMVKDWYARTDFSTFTVLSCEVKESFPIPTSIGEIPFNFIWDRFDQMGEHVYRVMDYKSNRASLSPTDLHDKVQARSYGLAAQIKYPDAQQIWVEFDMLRHGGPVGTVFTRDDNIETWKALKRAAQRIIDTPDGEGSRIPETINDECNYCVRKTSCPTLLKNIAVGGVFSLDPIRRVDVRADLAAQKKAVEAALNELDSLILADAKELDQTEFLGEQNKQIITARSTRYVDPDMVFQIIGPELTRKYGGSKITMAAVDKLLEGDELDDAKKAQVRGLIGSRKGEPYVMTKPLPRI